MLTATIPFRELYQKENGNSIMSLTELLNRSRNNPPRQAEQPLWQLLTYTPPEVSPVDFLLKSAGTNPLNALWNLQRHQQRKPISEPILQNQHHGLSLYDEVIEKQAHAELQNAPEKKSENQSSLAVDQSMAKSAAEVFHRMIYSQDITPVLDALNGKPTQTSPQAQNEKQSCDHRQNGVHGNSHGHTQNYGGIYSQNYSNAAFSPFHLPTGEILESHQTKIARPAKQAATLLGPQVSLQQAHQQMAGFMQPAHLPPPASPVPANSPAGTAPAVPGHQTLTGIPQRPIGLDQPRDTRAAALPGTPGHAATNVIDQQGALDPRGMTIDGNNAAGVKKLGAALDVTGGDRPHPNKNSNGDSDEAKIKRLQATGHGAVRCTACGDVSQCRCLREHHMNLDIPERTVGPAECYSCRTKQAGMMDVTAALRAMSNDPARR